MTNKQKLLLVVRFCGFFVLWFVVAQIVFGALYGIVYLFNHGHEHEMLTNDERVIHFMEDFQGSTASIVIVVLSLVFSVSISAWQTINKIKKYKNLLDN